MDSMDVAFVLVDQSTTKRFAPIAKGFILPMIDRLLQANYDARFALIKTDASGGVFPPASVHPFTASMVTFSSCLPDNSTPFVRRVPQGTNAVYHALQDALKLEWRTTNPNGFHENAVFLITDALPCGYLVNPQGKHIHADVCACDDLWNASSQYTKQNLTLAIVGLGKFACVCEQLYSDIAQNTGKDSTYNLAHTQTFIASGGGYLPSCQAAELINPILQSVISQGDTWVQSFRHVPQKQSGEGHSSRDDYWGSKHGQMMAHKGAWLMSNTHLLDSY